MLYLMYIFLVLYELSCNGITARVEYRRQLPLRQLMLRAGYNFGSRHKMPVAKQAELLAAVLNQVKKVGKTQRDKDQQLDNKQQRKLLRLLQRNYAAHQHYVGRARARTSRISNPGLIEQFQQRLKQMETPKTLTAEDYSSAEQVPSLKKVLRNLRRGVGDAHLHRKSPAFLHKSLGQRRYGSSREKKKQYSVHSDDDLKGSIEEVREAAIDDSNWNRKNKHSSYTEKTTKWKLPEIKVFALTNGYKANEKNNDQKYNGERLKVINKSYSNDTTDKGYLKENTYNGYLKDTTDKGYSKKNTYKGSSKEKTYKSYSQEKTYKKESPTFSERSTSRWTPGPYKLTQRRVDDYKATQKEQNALKASGKKLFGRTPMQFLGKVGIYEEK